MKDVVGLVVGGGSVSATLVRGSAASWTDTRTFGDGEELGAVLRELLASVPRRGRRRVVLRVVVDAPFVQIRRLEGLPTLDERLMTRLVTEGASSLFLKRDGGLVIAAVHREGDTLWGAAFDRDVVEQVAALADELRFDLGVIAAASHFLDQYRIGRDDLDDTASRIHVRTPLAWTRQTSAMRDRRGVRWLARATLGIAAMAAWVSPTARDALDERRLTRELAADWRIESEARRSIAELKQITQALDERALFDANRGRVSGLLDAITSALPESTALLSLRVDSLDVNLVALSPRVTAVLPALGTLREARAGRVIGAVSHELVDGVRLQRAAFRFNRWTGRAR